MHSIVLGILRCPVSRVTTIFAPYFVAKIFSGMVLTIVIPMRKIFRGFDEIIKIEHLEALGKTNYITGTIGNLL